MTTAHIFLNHFRELSDLRQSKKILYPLNEMLLLACAALSPGPTVFQGLSITGKKSWIFCVHFFPTNSRSRLMTNQTCYKSRVKILGKYCSQRVWGDFQIKNQKSFANHRIATVTEIFNATFATGLLILRNGAPGGRTYHTFCNQQRLRLLQVAQLNVTLLCFANDSPVNQKQHN